MLSSRSSNDLTVWWEENGPFNYKLCVISTIHEWAPALLVFFDEKVRDNAEEFVEKVVFENTLFSARDQRVAIAKLADGLIRFIYDKFPSNRQTADESMFSSTMSILNKCKEFLDQDDVGFEGKIDGMNPSMMHERAAAYYVTDLKLYIDRIVQDEEEDADAASGMSNSSSSTAAVCFRNSREANPELY